MSNKPFRIALVAGEASSDLIGATLINQLFELNPNIKVLAVGGEKIAATQAELIRDNEVFSIMGLVEVLKDLPRLMKIKKQIVQQIINFNPNVFIGVDSPDLNFSIAKSLKKQHTKVIHYVSPSVWAWRPKRVYKMQKFIDCLLTLFPFESDCYEDTSINTAFVGHPLATRIPVKVNKEQAKLKVNLTSKKVFALLPGSRTREIETLVPVFAATLKRMHLSAEWTIVSSNVSNQKIKLVNDLMAKENLSVQWVDDTSELLQAADFALLGSGTVALEAMLAKTPMVVAYKISSMTWHIVNTFNMMQLPYYSLPNVLNQSLLVPEVMQNELNPENLKNACESVFNQTDTEELIACFTRLHESLIPPHPQQAAMSVLQFLEESC